MLVNHDNMITVLSTYGGEWKRFEMNGNACYMSDANDVVEVVRYENTSAELIVRKASRYLTNRAPVGVPFEVVFNAGQ